ncbi:MAG: 3-dehydroquinate synthase [Planctomycetota bacterium]|nr:MAG: 3-dehydroquinate synthase [Planctomycetota bacterium]
MQMEGLRSVIVRTDTAGYPVEIARGAVRHVAERMAAAGLRPTSVAIICDTAVESSAAAAVDRSLRDAGIPVARIAMNASEDMKTLGTLGDLCERMLADGIDRAGAVVAVGGGVVGDVAGFAAATYMRGIACVQVPTTLLAMVDAAVGGKTAVNLARPDGSLAKNIIGSFAQPILVICDPESLATLPTRELRSGLAECVKHAVIADPEMLAWIAERIDPILAHDPATLAELVERNVRIKADVVGADEREQGRRAVLNLGHTFAHAIEALLHDECTHGEAVAIGTLAACRLAVELGLGTPDAEHAVRSALQQIGLPTAIPSPRSVAALIEAMGSDKKKQGGTLRLVVPFALGDVRLIRDVPDPALDAAWRSVGAR